MEKKYNTFAERFILQSEFIQLLDFHVVTLYQAFSHQAEI